MRPLGMAAVGVQHLIGVRGAQVATDVGVTRYVETSLRVFAMASSHEAGAAICERLQCPLARHEERDFEDGEHKSRPLESVRGKDVYVVASLNGSQAYGVNERLSRMLFFLAALRDAGAERLTAVVPYLCYARKDRRTKPRDPVTTRYVARLFEAMDIDRILTMDVHNVVAYQNAFRIPAEHVEAHGLLVSHLAPSLAGQQVVVVSPDAGGVKRAERFRQILQRRLGAPVRFAFMEKQRSEGEVWGAAFAGDVEGSTAVIVDDIIASGGTLARVAEACRARGAHAVLAASTHGVFVSKTTSMLSGPAIDKVVITDTVQPLQMGPKLAAKVDVLQSAGLLSDAIRRLHMEESLTELGDG